MDIQEYADYQARLINDLGSQRENLMHMAAGISGEAGEVLDIIKKNFAYGKALDQDHLIEEIGDTLFYLSGIIRMIDSTWEEVMSVNIAKLARRYPDAKFNADHAINRDTAAEKVAMETSSGGL